MFDHKSDYAMNKYDPDAIVCRSVTDVHIRLTRADFANEEEFQKWKEWSDHDYHAAEKAGRGFYDHVLPLDERLDAAEPSLEELMLGAIELAASYIMESTHGEWLWDYRRFAFNFEGRIALNPSIRFGIGGMVFLYVLQPLFKKLTAKMSDKTLYTVSLILFLLLIADVIFTFCL